MLAERAKQWTEDWFAEGRESGLKEGIEQGWVIGLTQGFEQAQRQMLLRQARLKFDVRTAERLSEMLNLTALPAALREVGDSVIECSSGLELLIRTLGEQGKHWQEEWVAEGRRSGLQEGLEKGRDQGLRLGMEKGRRDLAVRQTRLKFGDAAAERLLPLLDRVPTAAILAEVGDWVIQCGDAAELLARVENAASSGNGQNGL
ncbi:MAG: hypothetical protein F4229_00955 [Gammaproteobacteria bacterium]|nr:hypothetical protein [Gammaproteobacteria bacterium]